jgi:hypothetical protein
LDKAPIDVSPLFGVEGSDRRCPDPHSCGQSHLVAHQRDQGANDERGATSALAEHTRPDEVHDALAPARSLHDKQPSAGLENSLYRLELALAKASLAAKRVLENLQGTIGRTARNTFMSDTDFQRIHPTPN